MPTLQKISGEDDPLASIFDDLVKIRNRIVHSFQITEDGSRFFIHWTKIIVRF
mgnify:CR=1 FL=1